MLAEYSPLFRSGLLTESNSPSTSRRSSLEPIRSKVPRGSLPVDASIDSLYETPTLEDDAIFLTFMPRRRRAEQGNSFLSLDLAESQSMRSMSLRRKDTVTTRATTRFGRSVPASPVPMSPPMVFASFAQMGASVLPRKSLVRHSSREGLPGAKPVPSSQLPAAPQRKHRPVDLTLTLSSALSSVSSGSRHRSAHSDPLVLSPISPLLTPDERSYFMISPPTSPRTMRMSYSRPEEGPHTAPATTPLRARPSVRSTVSFRTRQVNRSAALAALEGRGEWKQPPRPRPDNFMSMSDDEDEEEDEPEMEGGLPSTPGSAPTAAFPVEPALLEVLQEEEDVVVPSSIPASRKSISSNSRKSRSRRGTIESLLSPLTNFIDFRDDEGSTRSWRSFVEIS